MKHTPLCMLFASLGYAVVACGGAPAQNPQSTTPIDPPATEARADQDDAPLLEDDDAVETGAYWGDNQDRPDQTPTPTAAPVGDKAEEPVALDRKDEPAKATGDGTEASAKLEPVGKGTESGTLELTQRGKTVTLTGKFSGLRPGKRGLQIKTNGSCEGKGASKAGPDFNPTKAKHGPPSSSERHAGDFGNLEVGDDGTATFEMKTDSINLGDGPNSVVGRAVIVTRNRDNGRSSPSGNAGPAVACGVIERAE